jgi:A/G-specific adenine glycosylase
VIPTEITADVRKAFQSGLLEWYRENRRDLPWRQRQDDPYAVWVSEIMLQQTQVKTVIPYYERWMSRFPTVGDLAEAPLEEVLRFWSGLGYYARARSLHRSAQLIVGQYNGVIPSDPEILGSLPGIGRYTLGALLSIAFQQKAAIVDANVTRVLCRVFGIEGDPKSKLVNARLWALAESLIPDGEARDFNQAIMELGALVCSPSDPDCERCPLLDVCIAGNSPDPTALPQMPQGKKTVRATHVSVIVRLGSRVLMIQQPMHGLWGGLWEFPRRVCEPGETPEECACRAASEAAGLQVKVGCLVGKVKHAVTHYAITLLGYEAQLLSEGSVSNSASIKWVALDEMETLPLSSPQTLLYKSFLNHLRQEAKGVKQYQLSF